MAAPRKIHQNPAHETGGDGEKVNTVLPIHLPCIDQAQEGFMDQFRRLKRMPSALGGNVALGDPMQLVVNKRQELLKASSSPSLHALSSSVTSWEPPPALGPAGVITALAGFSIAPNYNREPQQKKFALRLQFGSCFCAFT